MASNFYVEPANPLQALLTGQQAYGQARKTRLEDEQRDLIAQLGASLTGGGDVDYRGAAAIAARAGKPELAIQLAKLHEDRSQNADFMRQYGNILGGGGPSQGPVAALVAPQRTSLAPPVEGPSTATPGPPGGGFKFGDVVSAIGPDGVDRAPAMQAVGAPQVAQAPVAPGVAPGGVPPTAPPVPGIPQNPATGKIQRFRLRERMPCLSKAGMLSTPRIRSTK